MKDTKPLIASGVTIQAIVTIIAAVVALWGVELDELSQQQLIGGATALTTLIGMVISRYKADKEIKGILRTPK